MDILSEIIKSDLFKYLIGGLLGAFLTFTANYFLKKKEFKDDFYKKIIDKRMTAHEYLESYLTFFLDIKGKNETSGLGFKPSQEFSEFYKMTDKLSIHSFWFSSELDKEIHFCRSNVRALRDLYTEPNIDPYKVKRYYENIDNTITTIKQIHFEDFLHLDEVKKFIDDKPYATYQAINYMEKIELGKKPYP